ncbi:MAG: TRAP transporter small permease [Proteobacteria bacterium]|nr:TRAP transporter small permease [Pseudomonadota bacterium]
MALFDRFLRILALASGGIVLLLMLYTVADVVLRYAFNRPFSGSIEVTEFAMALIVFLAIPYCGWVGGHIAVDLFEKPLDRLSPRLLPALVAFAGAAVFALAAWRSAIETFATIHQISNMLRMPHYPFRFAVSLCSALFALVLLVQGVASLRRRNGKDGADVA